jgi:hypothetical protein
MKKSQYLVFIFLLLGYLYVSYVEYRPLLKIREPKLNDLNISVVNLHKTLNHSSFHFLGTGFAEWGLKKSMLLVQREKKTVVKKEKKVQSMKITPSIKRIKRILCLEKKCWEFVGVATINGMDAITLLEKSKNSKLKTLKIGEELLDNLTITAVESESIRLYDKKMKKNIHLKLFDVNMSKYYPKTIPKEKDAL